MIRQKSATPLSAAERHRLHQAEELLRTAGYSPNGDGTWSAPTRPAEGIETPTKPRSSNLGHCDAADSAGGPAHG